MENTTENTKPNNLMNFGQAIEALNRGRKGVSHGMERKGNVSLEKAGF